MIGPYESISAPPNEPPTVAEEVSQRQAHCAILADWFRHHPWQEIAPDELKALVGDNYQQRISELRKSPGPMVIENVAKWETIGTRLHRGKLIEIKRKLSGSYRFRPQEALGRDPSLPTHQAELFR